MATFREAREALLFAYQDGSIDDTEFALLYDLNSSENLEFPYWKYGRFDLDSMTDDECKTEFRFFKNDIYLLGEVLDIPDINIFGQHTPSPRFPSPFYPGEFFKTCF